MSSRDWSGVLLFTLVVGWSASAHAQRWFRFEAKPPASWVQFSAEELQALRASPESDALFGWKTEAKGVWQHVPTETLVFVAYRDHFRGKKLPQAFNSSTKPLLKDARDRGLSVSQVDLEVWPPRDVDGSGFWQDTARLRTFARYDEGTSRVEQSLLFARTGFVMVNAVGKADSWPESDIQDFYEGLKFADSDLNYDPASVEPETSYEQAGANIAKTVRYTLIVILIAVGFGWWSRKRGTPTLDDDEPRGPS